MTYSRRKYVEAKFDLISRAPHASDSSSDPNDTKLPQLDMSIALCKAQSTAVAPSRKILIADNASETSGISANPMSSSGQVQPVFTMAGTGGSGLQIVSEKLSETNYASWAVVVELYVEGHDKLDILHGTKVKLDEKDPSFRTWRCDNIQLMTWMLNSINSGIKQVILHNKTAYDMWKTLEQMYGRRHDMLCTYQISSQIFKLEQGSMSVTNYFATLKGLWDEFDYYRMENWSSTDDHQRYLKLLEKNRIIKFLDGLAVEFENLTGQILGLDPTPSLEQVYYKILSEEGATDHMTNVTNSFISYSLSSGQEKVIIADGTKATVAGKGSIKLTDHFFLSSALHVPSVSINLLSVSSITKQLHCSVTFFPDHCVFQDLETKQTIGTGREVGGLYYYQLETTSALKSAAKCLGTKHQEILLWHSRLGHFYPNIGENITSSFVPQVVPQVPQVVSSPIPLDVIENRKDAPSLGKDVPSLGAQSSPDIITYKRRRHKQEPTIDRLVESDALAPDPVKQLSSSVESTAPLNMNELNLPVAVRKGVRSCTQHPISNHVSYSRLSPSYHAFVSQLSNHAIPSSYYEAVRDSRPDITYAVSVVSQYMHVPKTIHIKAVDRILRYLKSCPGKGLLFKGGGDLKIKDHRMPCKKRSRLVIEKLSKAKKTPDKSSRVQRLAWVHM
ncbi:hypothetical protein ZIOFF_069880 [Zingiber officinale]|uniref:Retrovirus-related Pol polyprotein from transposon TNT 1-94-like beta-barrel domain-containing protein n=1 Tax=Zingiber officinale TaxID=94328 RepID=A0A8J5ES49_ZINOF|nr:hypothetical protein ZIOFF_069880 [Zingiber officinale]